MWDTHYGALRTRSNADSDDRGALLNPVQAVDHLSMALTGTDLFHDIDFQAQAEAYRRDLVRALNHEHAYGGPEKRDRSWEASPEFFASLDAFAYTPPSIGAAIEHRAVELGSLLVWALLWLGAAWMGAGRLERDGRSC